MRLQMILPQVDPEKISVPTVCPYKGCGGKHLKLVEVVEKPLRDTRYARVMVHRCECMKCHRRCRVYPQGVSRDHISRRVKGLAVLLYLLGLSYTAVSLALESLGVYMCRSRVYDTVQASAKQVPGMKRQQVFGDIRTPALGSDVTSVKVKGAWVQLGITVDDIRGVVLSIDQLPGEDAATLQEWIAPIVAAVGATVLVTDDADALKIVADALGLKHQVCKSHVKRNTVALIEELLPLAERDCDKSLAAIGVSVQQAQSDLKRLEALISSRKPEEAAELEQLHMRYIVASPPEPGANATLAYRLRLLFLDRWNLWPRLTRYRTWRGPNGERLDGTNNTSERGIGWWIKERYRTMRGYKRTESAVNVSRLLAWCGNHLDRGGADLAAVFA